MKPRPPFRLTRPNRSGAALLLATISLLAVAGCGGSGESTPAAVVPPRTTFQIPIQWAEQSRQFSGPASALSAVVRIKGTSENEPDATLTVNRRAAPDAYTETVSSNDRVLANKALDLDVTFRSGSDGLGDIVGIAAASVRVTPQGVVQKADGTALGAIATTGSVLAVMVGDQGIAEIGSSKQLIATVVGPGNAIVAVPPAGVFWTLQEGAALATLSPRGLLTPTAPGTCRVVATVDGMASGPRIVSLMHPKLNARRLGPIVKDILAVGGKLYATSQSNSPVRPNQLLEIDPANGAILRSINLGSNLGVLAATRDGAKLYVGVDGENAVKRVDVATFQVEQVVPLGSGNGGFYFALDISPSPDNPNVIAVSLGVPGRSGFYDAVAIYEGAVVRTKKLTLVDTASSIEFGATGSVLYGYDSLGSGNTFFVIKVDAQGVTITQKTRFENTYGTITYLNGRIYGVRGEVFDPVTLTPVGSFSPPFSTDLMAIDLATERAIFFGGSPDQILVHSTATYAQVAVTEFKDDLLRPRSLQKVGPKSIAIVDFGGELAIYDQVPGM